MREPKKKAVKAHVVDVNSEEGMAMYAGLARLIDQHHAHLNGARIALAWNESWAEDPDGHTKLGRAQKATDLHRKLHRFDFVISLNPYFWHGFSAAQRDALLDHELCHCEVARDDEGDPKEDDEGHTLYRIRKHDIEEFTEVARRRGLWKSDLVRFADVLQARRKEPLLAKEELPAHPAGPPASAPADAGAAMAAFVNNPTLLRAAERLCPDGKDVTAVTLTPESLKRIRAMRQALEGPAESIPAQSDPAETPEQVEKQALAGDADALGANAAAEKPRSRRVRRKGLADATGA